MSNSQLVLYVDLSAKLTTTKEIPQEVMNECLGGVGLAAWLLEESLFEEPLIFTTGPLSGTIVPASSQLTVMAVSPLTGLLATATTPTPFGAKLRRAGFLGIVITGKSEEPVYLMIDNEGGRIGDAKVLKGKSPDKVSQSLRQFWGDPQIEVAAIGEWGELGLPWADIVVSDQGKLSRSGLGADMGKKGIKAIAVAGHGPVQCTNTEQLVDNALAIIQKVRQGEWTGSQLGGVSTSGGLSTLLPPGSIPQSDEIHRVGCYSCPVMCPCLSRDTAFFPDWEPILGYQEYLVLGSIPSVTEASQLQRLSTKCREFGVDAVALGMAINFLTESGTINAHRVLEQLLSEVTPECILDNLSELVYKLTPVQMTNMLYNQEKLDVAGKESVWQGIINSLGICPAFYRCNSENLALSSNFFQASLGWTSDLEAAGKKTTERLWNINSQLGGKRENDKVLHAQAEQFSRGVGSGRQA